LTIYSESAIIAQPLATGVCYQQVDYQPGYATKTPESGEKKMLYNPKYVRILILAIMVAALIGLFLIVGPIQAGHCPAPNIPVCP
jgi:hypothetical protein